MRKAAVCPDLGGKRLQPLPPARRDGNARPAARQQLGREAADPGRRARDQSRLAIEPDRQAHGLALVVAASIESRAAKSHSPPPA